MKKKLVAFAVTAAMVVTSAVPALAWSPVNTGPTMPVSNEVVMDSTHLQDGIVNEKNVAISDGAEHSITVDFNRTNGNFTYTLKMSGDQGAEFTKYVTINDNVIAVPEATLEGAQQTATPEGIATLTWRFVTVDGVRYVEFVVDEMSTPKEDATLTMKLDTNDKDEIEAVTVDSVEFTQWSGGNNPGWKALKSGKTAVLLCFYSYVHNLLHLHTPKICVQIPESDFLRSGPYQYLVLPGNPDHLRSSKGRMRFRQ